MAGSGNGKEDTSQMLIAGGGGVRLTEAAILWVPETEYKDIGPVSTNIIKNFLQYFIKY